MGSGGAATCLKTSEEPRSERRALSHSRKGDYHKTRQLRHGSTAPDALHVPNSAPRLLFLLTDGSLAIRSASVGSREKLRIFTSLRTSIEKSHAKRQRMTESSAQWSLSFPLSKLIIYINYELLKKFKPTLCTSCCFISAGIHSATEQVISLYVMTRLNSSFFLISDYLRTTTGNLQSSRSIR